MRPPLYKKDIITYCTCAHRSAQDIFLALKEKHPRIGQATIYRTIKVLVAEGELIKIDGLGECAHYEAAEECHGHIIDEETGAVADITLPTDFLKDCKLPKDFDVSTIDLKVYGTTR